MMNSGGHDNGGPPGRISRFAAGAERRDVTVLFADIAGFTNLSERLDLEDVWAVVGEVMCSAKDIVERHDGQVRRVLGDEVMAVFGDPVAGEGDATRAIRAAFELHAAVARLGRQLHELSGHSITMHSGINSGVVVTEKWPVPTGVTTGPLGDAVNIAARLQSMADAGEILVGPDTSRLAAEEFELEFLGPRWLRGRHEPVGVSRVIGRSAEPRSQMTSGDLFSHLRRAPAGPPM